MINHDVFIGTYHNTCTVLLSHVFERIAKELNVPFYDVSQYSPFFESNEQIINFINREGEYSALKASRIVFDGHSKFGGIKQLPDEARGFFVVRNPISVICSCVDYHMHSKEKWLHRKLEKFSGLTYQEKIKSFESNNKKYQFEMDNASGAIIEAMSARAPSSSFANIKIESLFGEFNKQIIDNLFCQIGFVGTALRVAGNILTDVLSNESKYLYEVNHFKQREWLTIGKDWNEETKQKYSEKILSMASRIGYKSKFEKKRFDTVSRVYKVVDYKNILDTPKFLNNSEVFFKRYTGLNLQIIEPAKQTFINPIFFPHTSHHNTTIVDGELMMKEHIAYRETMEPISEADYHRISRKGYTDHPDLIQTFNNQEGIELIQEPCFYMGTFINAYGHFIWESLPRIYFLKDLIERGEKLPKLVFHFSFGDETLSDDVMLKYCLDYFDAFNIKIEDLIFIDRPIKFSKIEVHSPVVIPSHIECHMSTALRDMAIYIHGQMASKYTRKIKLEKKLYFSRSRVKNPTDGRCLLNADEVEQYFISQGFYIVYPEDLSSEFEKHALLSKAEIIAGVAGSGLFNSMFVPRKITVLAIESESTPHFSLAQQIQLNYIKGDDSFIYFGRQSTDKELKDAVWSVDVADLNNKVLDSERLAKYFSDGPA